MTRHRDIEIDPLVKARPRLLAAGHREGRRQPGASSWHHRRRRVAHADPASDIPSALLALRATVVAQGPDGDREIAIDDFFTGFLESASPRPRSLTEIRVPKVARCQLVVPEVQPSGPGLGHRRGIDPRRQRLRGVGLVNMASVPLRATAVEEAVVAGADAADAAALAAEGASPSADLSATVEYREHLARVLVRRGLEAAGRRPDPRRPAPAQIPVVTGPIPSTSTPSSRDWRARDTSQARAWPPRCSSPWPCSGRCSSRVIPVSARPRSPRRSRRGPVASSSACSATRGSTLRRPCTSGTTPASCCTCGPPRRPVVPPVWMTAPSRTSSTTSASSSGVRCWQPWHIATPSHRCSWSTRSIEPTTSSRPSCWRCSPTTR